MNSVAKLSEVKDLLIRPLCQKLIRDSLPIREGWVNKEEMLDIQGRGRYRQIALAEEYGVKSYQNPGGGCLLTDVGFSRKLKDLFEHQIFEVESINLLKSGRHFRLSEDAKFIVGRNNNDNEMISSNAGRWVVFQTAEIPGPLGLLVTQTELDQKIIELAASLLLRYNNKAPEEAVVKYGMNFNLTSQVEVSKLKPEEAEKYLI